MVKPLFGGAALQAVVVGRAFCGKMHLAMEEPAGINHSR